MCACGLQDKLHTLVVYGYHCALSNVVECYRVRTGLIVVFLVDKSPTDQGSLRFERTLFAVHSVCVVRASHPVRIGLFVISSIRFLE